MPADPRSQLRTVVLYTTDPWDSALPVLRVRGPAAVAGIEVVRGNDGDAIAPERVSEAELVIIQRDFPRFESGCQAVTARALAEGKPVIYEMDDLLLDLPEGHLMARAYSDVLFSILRTLVEADAVVASTPQLCAYLQEFNSNTHLLPNYLDDRLWSPPEHGGAQADKAAPLVIGYMGGQTHLPDLTSITPCLLRILARFGDQVTCQFWGVEPPAALLARSDVTWTALNMLDYTEFARYFSKQACDIFIAPLCDNAFNRCKSHIKYLEYSAMGVPGVYSRLAPYDRVVKPGENGLLAASAAEWEQALALLIESPGLRSAMGGRAQATVRQDWLLSRRAPDWLGVYQRLAASGRQPVLVEAHRRVLARVARQVQGRQRELEGQVRTIVQQAAEQAMHVTWLTHELAEIHSSRAWRLALLIRGLRYKLAPHGSRRDRWLTSLLNRLWQIGRPGSNSAGRS